DMLAPGTFHRRIGSLNRTHIFSGAELLQLSLYCGTSTINLPALVHGLHLRCTYSKALLYDSGMSSPSHASDSMTCPSCKIEADTLAGTGMACGGSTAVNVGKTYTEGH